MIRKPILLTTVLLLAACGGNEPEADAGLAQAPDPNVQPVEREPLTDADLVGLDMADLAVELPWTANIVNRNPGPAAPRSLVEGIDVSSHDAFDRMTFTFSSDAPFPGYRIALFDPGAAIGCGMPSEGDEGEPEEEPDVDFAPELTGDRFLVLAVMPGWIVDGGRETMTVGVERYDLARVYEAGVTCAEDETVTWVAGLKEGTAVRVLELRSPQRLVVDVR